MRKTAAKERKLFFLAAALVLAGAFLISMPAEASRTLDPPITALEPRFASTEALENATCHDQVEPENRFRLFEDLSLPPHPLEWVLVRKTASGVFDLGIECNVWQTGGLSQNCSSPSFQGLWTDPTTGLSYARNRWYDARTASWLSEDPMGAVDSPNLYAFVGWQPHMATDPMGLHMIPEEEIEAWKAANPGYHSSQLYAWLDAKQAEHHAAENEESWFSTKWDSLRGWYSEHARFGGVQESIDAAKSAASNQDNLRWSYTDVHNDVSLQTHSTGRQTGMGEVLDSNSRVVIAGVMTAVIFAEDIGTLTGSAAIAKYGLKEGMQYLVRRSGGAKELIRVVDGKIVRELGDDVLRLAERNLTTSGDTVLGHFPGYINKAKAKGGSYFDIGDAWGSLTETQQWEANRHFLNIVSSRGDRILLSLPKTKIRPGSSLAKEVEYLTKERGYVWVNQWSLKPGG